MVQSTLTDSEDIADIVTALTGPEGAVGAERGSLREQLQLAAEDLDADGAQTACRSLIALLAEDPGRVRELEALILLGLAHPRVLDYHRIPVTQEGRRLAVLLENAGEVERAQVLLEVLAARNPTDKGLDKELAALMRRTGNADRLVERYLRRAEESVAADRPMEAIPWLQEVLLIDRSRRDVGRMIRDLRYQEEERRTRVRRRVRAFTLMLFTCAVIGLVVWRELELQRQYNALPPAIEGNIQALELRANSLESLVSDNPMWLGAFRIGSERRQLRTAIVQIEAAAAEREREAEQTTSLSRDEAESERLRARTLVDKGDFRGALKHYRRSLVLAPDDWEGRGRVTADIDAIEGWLEDNQGSIEEADGAADNAPAIRPAPAAPATEPGPRGASGPKRVVEPRQKRSEQ